MECGDCTACCHALPIYEIDFAKPEGELCIFCDNGCTVYDARPESCRNFSCDYALRDGSIMDVVRPDKTGVIFERIYTKIYIALITESVKESWDTSTVMGYINNLNSEGISVIACSLKHGIVNVFNAEGHNSETVVRLAQEVTR